MFSSFPGYCCARHNSRNCCSHLINLRVWSANDLKEEMKNLEPLRHDSATKSMSPRAHPAPGLPNKSWIILFESSLGQGLNIGIQKQPNWYNEHVRNRGKWQEETAKTEHKSDGAEFVNEGAWPTVPRVFCMCHNPLKTSGHPNPPLFYSRRPWAEEVWEAVLQVTGLVVVRLYLGTAFFHYQPVSSIQFWEYAC